MPAAPAAAQLANFMVDTGDDVATVARGLGMDAGWVERALRGEIDRIGATEAAQLCRGLDLSVEEVFGPTAPVSGAAAPTAFSAQALPRRRADRIVEELTAELGRAASEQGLEGRDRVEWVDRQLDALTDPTVPLVASGRSAGAGRRLPHRHNRAGSGQGAGRGALGCPGFHAGAGARP